MKLQLLCRSKFFNKATFCRSKYAESVRLIQVFQQKRLRQTEVNQMGATNQLQAVFFKVWTVSRLQIENYAFGSVKKLP